MTSNDMILNMSSIIMLTLLLSWGACFFIFVYKNLGGPKIGRDSLLYFNFMFFSRSVLSGLSLTFLVLAYMAAAITEYRRDFNDSMLIANVIGVISLLLFGLYGRFFYNYNIDDMKPFFFIKIFLTRIDFSFGSIFLWLSRFAYATWIVEFIRN